MTHRTFMASQFARLPLALMLVAAAVAPASTRAEEVESTEFFPKEEIHAGLEGVARTTFEGDAVEEFGVEFLGVLKNAIGPQQDMILARLHGEKVEFTGVISGMSGSPVYVDGRLVGAISYRLGQFGKEPIAGITPIADMMKVADIGRPAGPATAGMAPDLLGGFLAGGGDAAGEGAPMGPAAAFGTPAPPVGAPASALGGLQPIGTPLVCSGCDSEVLQYYAPIFRSYGLEPTAGGGMAEIDTPLPLVPGSGLGAALATGDLTLTAIGTLTHVEGDRVFAFGHPFLGTGSMEIPMTQAQVLLTFASAAASFRIANATAPIGTLLEDRLTAIVGEVGRTPPTMPLTIGVAAPSGRREFHYDVARDRSWAPVLVALITANSLVRTTEYAANATLALRYRIDLEDRPTIMAEDLYSGTNPSQPVHVGLANAAAQTIALLYNNPWQEVHVRSAEVEVEVLEESQIGRVTALRASHTDLRPGEPFTVTATLTPFRGPDQDVTFEVVLPEDVKPGPLVIAVGGGSAVDTLDRQIRQRQVQQAAGVDDLIRLIGRQRKNRTLYLRATRRAPSAIVRSEILPDLPVSVFTVFNNPRLSADATVLLEAPIVEMARELDLVAAGGRRIMLKVK